MSEQVAPQRVLVAGIPGAGKTEYCRWLEQEKDFLHLDFDKLDRRIGTEKQIALYDHLRHSAERFLTVIAQIEQPIAIDWGFPPWLLTMVKCLHANGFAIWWFDGDRDAAREAFIARGTVSLDAFNAQMKSIEESWLHIQGEFGQNVVLSVSSGPMYSSPEYIYRTMFPK